MMDTQTTAKYVCQELDRQEQEKIYQLNMAAKSLSRKLTMLVEKLENGGTFNTLGEVQGAGAEIDRLIGELAMLRKINQNMPNMLKQAEIIHQVWGDQS